jgi:chromosome segregation ATPase
MFNLFPKKKSVDKIIEDANLAPSWQWTPTQTPSMLQAQNELIEQFLKENHDLKKENVKLKKEINDLNERVNEVDSDMNEEYRAEVFRLRNDNAIWKAKHQVIQNDYKKCTEQRDEYKQQLDVANKENENLKIDNWNKGIKIEYLNRDNQKLDSKLDAANKEIDKLKKDIVDYVFEKDDEVEKIKAQKHPMYPLQWSDISNALQKAKDLTAGVEVDLDKSLDEQCDEVKKSQNWSTLKVAMQDALLKTFPNEFQEEPAFLSCACGDCYEKTKQYNKFQDAYTECGITGYKIPKENSWEEAASDLALRVTKLEEHIKHVPKIILKNGEQEDNNPLYKHY